MRSSEFAAGGTIALATLLLLGVLGCSASPSVVSAVHSTPASVPCRNTTSNAKTLAPGVWELLRSIEAGPLFTAAIAPTGIASCMLAIEDGQTAVSYQSASGNQLVVRRDERIESTAQEARFSVPPPEPALAILAEVERSAFGTPGCGIAWDRPESGSSSAAARVAVTIYRGDVCNCQAIVERDRDDRVVGLALKSAC